MKLWTIHYRLSVCHSHNIKGVNSRHDVVIKIGVLSFTQEYFLFN